MKQTQPDQVRKFTAYQALIIALIAITQFTVVLDFMIMSPLGDTLMKSMHIGPGHFGFVVSAYAFSAGISGLLTAGFADRYDRKKLLLFFYIGFIAGTLFCGLAHTYPLLVTARIVTGLFGGVIGSISMAIITDIFAMEQRGRVMGFVQMAFGASQVLGIPLGLLLANRWGWESPFLMIVVLSVLIWLVIALRMRPVTDHLKLQSDKNPLLHLLHTISRRKYRVGFLATAMLSVGGFMMMPWGSAYSVNNLGIHPDQLPLLFMISGIGTLIIMPAVGGLSDKMDKLKLFIFGSVWMMVVVVVYTHLPVVPLWALILTNIMMMVGIVGRMVPSTTLVTALPDPQDRGAFMSINNSLQQIAGGIAAAAGGLIVVQQSEHSPLAHFDTLGYVIVLIGLVCIFLIARVNRIVKH